MKKLRFYTIICIVSSFSLAVHANKWNTPDKELFKYEKDLDKSVSFYSYSSATIFFNGELFNFMHYYYGQNKIIIRKIKVDSYTANTGTNVWEDIKWSAIKQDGKTNLITGFGDPNAQPAPVVFEGNLLLFMKRENDKIGYSKYDPANDSWSGFVEGPTGCLGEYLVALEVQDKLVLIAKDKTTSKVSLYWTKDLVEWKNFQTTIEIGTYKTSHDLGSNIQDYKISAIAKSYINNQSLDTKIMVSYIPKDQSVRVAEFAFDDDDQLSEICDDLVANEYTYSSAALVEGSVEGDDSNGICTQIFLKKSTKENAYCRYRILRYQKIEGGSWNKRENNLVPQNYLWADDYINLTAANFPYTYSIVNDLTDIEENYIGQKMCLVYRGYDDWDHPLNIAYATTDHLKYIENKDTILYDAPYLQFIGYIEGAPPFHLNEPSEAHPESEYTSPTGSHISEALFMQSKEYDVGKALSFDVESSIKMKIAGYSAAYSSAKGRENESSTKTTMSIDHSLPAQDSATGRYLCLAPKFIVNRYVLYNWKGDSLYNTYDVNIILLDHSFDIPLSHGFKYGDLDSYFDNTTDYIHYDRFNKSGYPPSISWISEGEKKATISIDDEESVTTNKTKSVTLGSEFGEKFLELEIKGSFDYTIKTTTTVGNEVSCVTNLNEAKRDTDVYEFDYTIWWLKKTPHKDNWWLYPDQDETEDTWCLTYQVTGYRLKDGTSRPSGYMSSDPSIEPYNNLVSGNTDILDSDSPKIQSYPNPFSSITTISYRISNDNPDSSYDLQQYTSLSVYNNSGKLVTVLVNEMRHPGDYEVKWDASSLPGGLYFCRLQNGNQLYMCKLVLIK